MHHRFRRVLPAAIAATTLATPIAASPAHAASSSRRAIPGNVPGWARAQRDRGDADSSQQVTLRAYLPLRDAAGAEALATSVSDPKNAQYGQFLTPEQFRAKFAPSDADVTSVESFLTSQGLKIGEVPANRHYVEATGTLAQAEKAFAVDVHQYAFRGQELNAPTAAPTVPANLAGKIVAVRGLDDSGALMKPLTASANDAAPNGAPAPADAPVAAMRDKSPTKKLPGPPPAFVNAPPCSSYYGAKLATTLPSLDGKPAPYAPCGYDPPQLQSAYGVKNAIASGKDGRGQTVAIVDAYAAPTILQDANAYAVSHGQPKFADGQFSQALPKKFTEAGPKKCDAQGWYGEETLDVEAVHGMAPGANVLYVAASSCEDSDFEPALNKIVDGKLANIVSNSYGDLGEDLPPATLTSEHAIYVQAAIEGISMLFSSGDDGDNALVTDDGKPVADYPATDPFVTAVGGTSLGVGKDGSKLFETGWATGKSSLSADGKSWQPPFPGDFVYGGGGGTSNVFPEPSYQQGVVPDAIANGHRAIPDTSLVGDPQTGMVVGETQEFPNGSDLYAEYRIGGTSLSSPLTAGLVALANQAGGKPYGFLNPKLYRAAGSPLFTDVAPDGARRAVVRVDYVNTVDASAGTTTSLRSLDDEAQTLHLAKGWDNLTGLGTPNAGVLLGSGR